MLTNEHETGSPYCRFIAFIDLGGKKKLRNTNSPKRIELLQEASVVRNDCLSVNNILINEHETGSPYRRDHEEL